MFLVWRNTVISALYCAAYLRRERAYKHLTDTTASHNNKHVHRRAMRSLCPFSLGPTWPSHRKQYNVTKHYSMYIYLYIYIYTILLRQLYIYIYILEPWLSCAMCVCFNYILTIMIVVMWTMLPLSKSCSPSPPAFFLLSCTGKIKEGGRRCIHTHMPARAVHMKVTTLPKLWAKSSSLRKTYMWRGFTQTRAVPTAFKLWQYT